MTTHYAPDGVTTLLVLDVVADKTDGTSTDPVDVHTQTSDGDAVDPSTKPQPVLSSAQLATAVVIDYGGRLSFLKDVVKQYSDLSPRSVTEWMWSLMPTLVDAWLVPWNVGRRRRQMCSTNTHSVPPTIRFLSNCCCSDDSPCHRLPLVVCQGLCSCAPCHRCCDARRDGAAVTRRRAVVTSSVRCGRVKASPVRHTCCCATRCWAVSLSATSSTACGTACSDPRLAASSGCSRRHSRPCGACNTTVWSV